MGMYVKWSWLLYMATAMWSALIINDWNNDFQNGNVQEFINDSVEETINVSKIQPQPIMESQEIKEEPIIQEPYKLVKKTILKEDLKFVEPVSIVNDTPTSNILDEKHDAVETSPSFEIIEDLNLILNLLDSSKTWWNFNWYWNCIAFIVLTLIYIVGRIIWKYGQNKVPKKEEEEPSEEKPAAIINITSSLTQQKKLISKIPTYKFKHSISDMAVSSTNHQTNTGEFANLDTSNLTDVTLKNNHFIQEINDYKKKLNDEEEMCFNLRQELIHIHDDHERDRENLNRKLEAVTIEKKELSKQLASVLKENQTLRTDLDQITLSRDNTTRKLSRIKEELRKSTKEKCNLNKQIIVMRKQNVSLHQTLERCRREMKQHQEKVSELEREILQLKTRLQCATIINKRNSTMKEHSEDLLKPTKGMSHMNTVTPEKLSPTKLSKFDIYSDVKSRIKNLENDIVNWETKNSDQILISNIQDGFNYFSNDIESILNNKNNGAILSSKKCCLSVHVCPEKSNNINNNQQDNILQNSLAYKLLSTFDPSWQAGPKNTQNSSPKSCSDKCDDNNSDLCSLD
ncbi:protein PFC0760c-like isoform X2 [Chrysoperla carnea]|uniref:protein PFC0760c-like isoform X2 n=1 Tax=Chrysoperla carnea TaxID=189513 RepID=UPI001D07F821|nr:protein PFC0760c-like isoform X2 [Chrysoperla carnea]